MNKVITRFAPSPTGNLHIGGCRTLLYNWLYAKKNKGQIILRIEDTDRERSSIEATKNIIESIEWLGLKCDGKTIYQKDNILNHQGVVQKLLNDGKAYYCYCSEDELLHMRESALKNKSAAMYNKKWRDKTPTKNDLKIKPTVRIKTPLSGNTIIKDDVQGDVIFNNKDLDDFILLRSDGSPTYLLASAVDDHDLGITHIIRGDDHLNNAARQASIFDLMEWDRPQYSHIPLIHSPDGTKLSKRDGALSVLEYKDEGFLPIAILNYLLRLGWSFGDLEYFTINEMIEYFDIKNIHKSPARFDKSKLLNTNTHYLREEKDTNLISYMADFYNLKFSTEIKNNLEKIIPHLKTKAKTLNEIRYLSKYIYSNEFEIPKDIEAEIINKKTKENLLKFCDKLKYISDWSIVEITSVMEAFIKEEEIKLMEIAKPLRLIITGAIVPTGIYELIYALGKDTTHQRISTYLQK